MVTNDGKLSTNDRRSSLDNNNRSNNVNQSRIFISMPLLRQYLTQNRPNNAQNANPPLRQLQNTLSAAPQPLATSTRSNHNDNISTTINITTTGYNRYSTGSTVTSRDVRQTHNNHFLTDRRNNNLRPTVVSAASPQSMLDTRRNALPNILDGLDATQLIRIYSRNENSTANATVSHLNGLCTNISGIRRF